MANFLRILFEKKFSLSFGGDLLRCLRKKGRVKKDFFSGVL